MMDILTPDHLRLNDKSQSQVCCLFIESAIFMMCSLSIQMQIMGATHTLVICVLIY